MRNVLDIDNFKSRLNEVEDIYESCAIEFNTIEK